MAMQEECFSLGENSTLGSSLGTSLRSFQNHVGNFDQQGNDNWLMNQVHVMLFWVEDLKSKVCDILNVDLYYFFGKLHNHNRYKKSGLIFHGLYDNDGFSS